MSSVFLVNDRCYLDYSTLSNNEPKDETWLTFAVSTSEPLRALASVVKMVTDHPGWAYTSIQTRIIITWVQFYWKKKGEVLF